MRAEADNDRDDDGEEEEEDGEMQEVHLANDVRKWFSGPTWLPVSQVKDDPDDHPYDSSE